MGPYHFPPSAQGSIFSNALLSSLSLAFWALKLVRLSLKIVRQRCKITLFVSRLIETLRKCQYEAFLVNNFFLDLLALAL